MSSEAHNNIWRGLLLFFLVVVGLIVTWVFLLVVLPKFYHQEDSKNEHENFGMKSIAVERIKIIPKIKKPYWKPVEISLIEDSLLRNKVEYGKELIAHTSKFLGPMEALLK